MDPLSSLLQYFREHLADRLPPETLQQLEQTAQGLFAQFELVPKHEFETHMEVLSSLNTQVEELEQRLKALEETR